MNSNYISKSAAKYAADFSVFNYIIKIYDILSKYIEKCIDKYIQSWYYKNAKK